MPKEPVLFDLDQTIIPWDTQLVFRCYVLRQEPWRRLLTAVFILFLPLVRVLGAGGMKRVFHSYLWRMKRETLDQHVQGFLTEWLPKLPYPEFSLKRIPICIIPDSAVKTVNHGFQ